MSLLSDILQELLWAPKDLGKVDSSQIMSFLQSLRQQELLQCCPVALGMAKLFLLVRAGEGVVSRGLEIFLAQAASCRQKFSRS